MLYLGIDLHLKQMTVSLRNAGRRRAPASPSQHAVAETRGVSGTIAASRDRRREVCGHRGSLRIPRLAGEMAATG